MYWAKDFDDVSLRQVNVELPAHRLLQANCCVRTSTMSPRMLINATETSGAGPRGTKASLGLKDGR